MCNEEIRRSAAGRRYLYISPAPFARDSHKRKRERQYRRLIHPPRRCMFEATWCQQVSVLLREHRPAHTHVAPTYSFWCTITRSSRRWRGKNVLSPMHSIDHCFEEYDIVQNCHLRRRDARSVRFIYPLRNPQSHALEDETFLDYRLICRSVQLFEGTRHMSLGSSSSSDITLLMPSFVGRLKRFRRACRPQRTWESSKVGVGFGKDTEAIRRTIRRFVDVGEKKDKSEPCSRASDF